MHSGRQMTAVSDLYNAMAYAGVQMGPRTIFQRRCCGLLCVQRVGDESGMEVFEAQQDLEVQNDSSLSCSCESDQPPPHKRMLDPTQPKYSTQQNNQN